MPQVQQTGHELSVVRSQRAGLRAALLRTEEALAAPLSGCAPSWALGVRGALTQLTEALAAHVTSAEGPGGLFEQVRTDAPRLAGRLHRLHADHNAMTEAVARCTRLLATGSDEVRLIGVRDRLTDLLHRLAKHRQAGADLLYQAYQVDIGGAE